MNSYQVGAAAETLRRPPSVGQGAIVQFNMEGKSE